MAQNPKGGGLSSVFGGTSSAQFGVQRTNDFMEKATWVLASVICILIVLSVVITANPKTIKTTSAKPYTSKNNTLKQDTGKQQSNKPASEK